MEQQKPQIPSLKDSQKPQVKIKGLQAGLSLIDRLKQFKKKDLMFISAGLGVLFMAPLAEHLLMAPEQGKGGAMTEGWSFNNKDGLGTNASPYESGINGLAPGGVTGGGDIITPLNVRDPSALVMGPGAQQQAPATNSVPAPPPSAAKEPDWKDALSAAAATGAKEATKKASLPVPKPSLTNAGLRGLGAVAGGGGGSFSPGAISSQGLAGNKAAGRDFNRVQAAPGYRGAAGARGANSGSSGSFENLKKAAGGMTDTLNRSGPASSALESAANSSMGGGGGSGIGAGGHGEGEKGPSGSQNKDSMNVGESLEFMRQKMEQEKALDLKWKLKEADAMLWPELRKDILKTLVTKPLEGLAGDIGKSFGAWGGDKSSAKKYNCNEKRGIPAGSVGKCFATGDEAKGYGLFFNDTNSSIFSDPNCTQRQFTNCALDGGAGEGKPKAETSPTNLTGVTDSIFDNSDGSGIGLEALCTKMEAHSKDTKLKQEEQDMAKAILAAGKNVVEGGQGLLGGAATQCGAKAVAKEGKSASALVAASDAKLVKDSMRPLYDAVHASIWALAAFETGGEPKKQSDAMRKELDKKTDASKAEAETLSAKLFDEKIAAAKKAMAEGVDNEDKLGPDKAIAKAKQTAEKMTSEELSELTKIMETVKGRLSTVETELKTAKEKLEAVRKDTAPELISTREAWISDVEKKLAKIRAYEKELLDMKERLTTKHTAVTNEVAKVQETVDKAKKLLGFEKQEDGTVAGLQKLGKETIKAAKMPTSLDKDGLGCERQAADYVCEKDKSDPPATQDGKDTVYGKEGKPIIDEFEKKAVALEGAVKGFEDVARNYRDEQLNLSPGGTGGGGGRPWQTKPLQYYQKGGQGVEIWQYEKLKELTKKKVGPGGGSSTPEATSSSAGVQTQALHDPAAH